MFFEKYKSYITPSILLLMGLFASFPTLRFYAQVNGMMLSYVGMLLLPLVFYIKEPGRFSIRFGVLVGICLLVYKFIPSHLVLLFGFYCFSFLVIECFIGKLNRLAIVLMVLASPIAYYLFEVFGFPIRLFLTKTATLILNMGGFTCQNSGNIIDIDGVVFSVDPVCMGLNMVMTSMLGSMILISFYEKNKKQYFTNVGLLLSISIALVLVIFANLIRIIFIILLTAAPETLLHESIGLLAMIGGVFFPLYLIIPFVVKYFSTQQIAQDYIANDKNVNVLLKKSLIGVFLIGLIMANQSHPTIVKEELDTATRAVNLEGYKKDVLKFPNGLEVVSLKNDQSLIYIKPQYEYRITNHSPLICWQGSGMEIKNEKTIEVGNHQVYTAELIGVNERYFTAWWFDNGKDKTIGNFDWRWKVWQGEAPFRLVNVSCSDFSQLYMEVEWLLEKDLFNKN